MECLDDGRLRAYLDGELPEAEREGIARHLEGCADCAARLADVKETAAAVGDALAPWQTEPAAAPDAGAALARFAARRRADERPAESRGGVRGVLDRLGSPRLRPAVAAVSLLVVLGLVFALSPLQLMAEDLFQTFRVQQFAAVTVHVPGMKGMPQPQQLTQAEQSQYAQMLQQLGTLTTTPAKLDNVAHQVASPQEARAHFPQNSPALLVLPADKVPAGFTGTQYAVSDPVSAQYTLNVQVARQYAGMLNDPDIAKLPWPNANQVTFGLDVPAAFAAVYGTEQHGFAIVQLASPTLTIPNTVDVEAFRTAVLALPNLPPDTVAQIKALDQKGDWSKTLIIPVPEDATTQNIQVNGHAGLLIVDAQGQHSLVLWEANGMLYGVGGTLTAAEAQAVANSLTPLK
ncbi:MAG TPA: zf-HC2 domain-containing protein [Thermomicrobiales bacterium]|nr:zf-HC2 domain-containing protein [Thermomicrobiales bacterium]